MTAIMVLFVGSGVFLIVTEDGAGRVLGVGSVLFFGFGGLVYLASEQRREKGAVRVVEQHRGVAAYRAVVVPVRPGKWLVMAVGAVGLGVGALLIGLLSGPLPDAGTFPRGVPPVAWLGGGFLVMIVAGLLTSARQGPPQLLLSPEGLRMTVGLSRSFVPWEAVVEVGVTEMEAGMSRQRFATVQVSDRSRIETPRGLRWLAVLNRGVSGWDVAYQEAPFDLDADEIAELVARLAASPDREAVLASLPPGSYSFRRLVARLEQGERPPG